MTSQVLEAVVSGSANVTLMMTAKDLRETVAWMLHDERRRIKEEAERQREQYVITREEAARMCHTSVGTLNRWAKTGYLVPKKIGVKVFYRQSDIDNINEINNKKRRT